MVNTQDQNLRKCPGLGQAITSHSSENLDKPQHSKNAATLPRLKQSAPKYKTTSVTPHQFALHHYKKNGTIRSGLPNLSCVLLATSAKSGQHMGNMKFNTVNGG
jgi:hypothetical protein